VNAHFCDRTSSPDLKIRVRNNQLFFQVQVRIELSEPKVLAPARANASASADVPSSANTRFSSMSLQILSMHSPAPERWATRQRDACRRR
jgi:hypothetical protein